MSSVQSMAVSKFLESHPSAKISFFCENGCMKLQLDCPSKEPLQIWADPNPPIGVNDPLYNGVDQAMIHFVNRLASEYNWR